MQLRNDDGQVYLPTRKRRTARNGPLRHASAVARAAVAATRAGPERTAEPAERLRPSKLIPLIFEISIF